VDWLLSLLTFRLEMWRWREAIAGCNIELRSMFLHLCTVCIYCQDMRDAAMDSNSRKGAAIDCLMFIDNANNTSIVYMYMRVCLECRIDTKNEWWDITNRSSWRLRQRLSTF